MKDFFTRSKHNPILKPNPSHDWEALKVYNPGAVFHNGKYHLFYRAVGNGADRHSVLGYAVSKDGEHFRRFSKPILDRDSNNPFEFRGLEDPRITKIGDKFFMAYAAYDGKVPRLHIATSFDLKSWKKHPPALKNFRFTEMGGVHVGWKDGKPIESYKPKSSGKDDYSKAGAIFPEKIGGKYWMLFNEFRIWLANSDDGIKWNALPWPFLEPRKNTDLFDNVFVEMGPPPIKTEKGWLVFYHGVNDAIQYHLGVLLLDLNDPTKILYRSKEPVFGPQEKYELSGMVDIIPGATKLMREGKEQELKDLLKKAEQEGFMPQVTFTTAAVVVDNTVRLYYGASDQFICTATAKLNNILSGISLESTIKKIKIQMKKLKIVMDFRKYDVVMAGVEIVVYELCKYLSDRGHKVVLLCRFNRIKEVKKIFSGLKNIKFVSLPVKSHELCLKNFCMDNFYIQNLAVREKADLIHFPYNWSFPVRKKVPCVLTIHDLIPFTYRDGMPWFTNKFIYKPGIKLAARLNNVVTTVSNFSKKDIVKKLGIRESKVKVIPNGFQEFKENFDKNQFNRIKKLIGDEYILNVGGLKERKNLIRLIKAFSKLVEQSYEGNLVITNQLSSAPYYERRYKICMKIARKYSVDKKIIFTDFLKKGVLGKVMKKANFTIYSSLYEGFGLPILESMNLKVPCITSNVTSMPEVAEDGALLVDPYSVEDIYKKMKRMLEDKKLRRDLIKKGEKIVKKYSWEKTGEMYLGIYRDLLK